MHIGFLTPEFPHPETGVSAGLGSSIKTLAYSLLHEGIKVSIFIYNQTKTKTIEVEGLTLHLIERNKYLLFGWYRYRKFLENNINRKAREDGIDVLEAPDWTGITAFMKLEIPIVIRMHGSDAYFCRLENRKQKKKNYWFEKKALYGADHVLSVSKFTALKTIEIFKLKKEVTVIPNGVNVRVFNPRQKESEYHSILYFGSLIRKKGVIELAHIFNKVVMQDPDAALTLVGKDVIDFRENRSTLEIFSEILTKEAKARFRYISEVPYEEIKDYISAHSLMVFPSFAEAFPMTWLESMAMEKALVTSNIGWAREIMINGKTGYMAEPRDHSEFAGRILTLLRDKTLRERMGRYSRERICKEFSAGEVVRKNIRFYEHVAGRGI